MSSITGKDFYGNKHKWLNKGTEQSPYPELRRTLFVCSNCGQHFYHEYHLIPSIYEAIERSGISEECEKKESE